MRFVWGLLTLSALWLVGAEVDRRLTGTIKECYWTQPEKIALAPWNLLIYVASMDRGPFIPIERFAGHQILEQNWKLIQQEAMKAENAAYSTRELITNAENISDSSGWKALPLFWYGKEYPEHQALCPETTKLLKALPQVYAAMFSVIPPGKEILPHRGPSKSCMRYHLGLIVPKERSQCYIAVDGTKYHWREGEGQLFDDTYHHFVRNDTDETRVVLFVEVERPLDISWIASLNHIFINSSLPSFLSLLNERNEKQTRVLNK